MTVVARRKFDWRTAWAEALLAAVAGFAVLAAGLWPLTHKWDRDLMLASALIALAVCPLVVIGRRRRFSREMRGLPPPRLRSDWLAVLYGLVGTGFFMDAYQTYGNGMFRRPGFFGGVLYLSLAALSIYEYRKQKRTP